MDHQDKDVQDNNRREEENESNDNNDRISESSHQNNNDDSWILAMTGNNQNEESSKNLDLVEEQDDEKQKIVIVDDDLNVLNALGRSLRSKRTIWDLEFINNPVKAITYAETAMPDIVISDLAMPEMTGIDMIHEMRSFAPETSYCYSPKDRSPITEFRDMVKALHQAGIEVILDVVFNHTSEGNHQGPVINFKGIIGGETF